MQQNRIQNMALFNVQPCFAGGGGGGALYEKTINSLCNDYKVALN